jgi:pSer/pThr/pTyr-binding forkhead associated (FHA) protein
MMQSFIPHGSTPQEAALMLAKLLEYGGGAEQCREIAIVKEEFLFGRGSDCDLRLTSKSVSRHHCMIRFRAGEATLGDLGSANGTFVNGQRIRSQVTLHDGDSIGLGDFSFTFTQSGGSGLQWGRAAASDPLASTVRIRDDKPTDEKKEEGHPPGEAGGQGEVSGKGV